MALIERHVNYYAHKFEAEQDLFYNIIHFSHSNTETLFQIGNTDLFYVAFYFSDSTITDVNLYYVKSKKLQQIVQNDRVIKFSPGTGEWIPNKGDLRDTHVWFFISRIISSTSKEIQTILNLEKDHLLHDLVANQC